MSHTAETKTSRPPQRDLQGIPTLREIAATRVSRRVALLGLAGSTAVVAGGLAARLLGGTALAAGPSSLTFTELARIQDQTDHVAPGYTHQVLVRWGDPIVRGAPTFDFTNLTAKAQQMQFGYNCDWIGYMPLPLGSQSSDRGLLCVNNEYPSPQLMWSGFTEDEAGQKMSREQVDVTLAVHGHSVVEIQKVDGRWQIVADSEYNRRLSMFTEIAISGPAAGHDWMKTSTDAAGTRVMGTHDNCAGGTTPWGTVLTCEEGSGWYFAGDPAKTPDPKHLERYYYDSSDYYGWGRFYDRFNVEKEPNEPNRFEWVVEFDPYDPQSVPVKRTALGRFAHEGATTVLNKDGRVTVYLGDDWENEYAYRFVTSGKFDAGNRAANRDLLDDGTLSVAKFHDDGTMQWLPLVFGEGPLTPANGFNSQAEVLIKTRQAADLVGATPMDRPEDFETNPVTGRVYLVLTDNEERAADAIDAANPRPGNPQGHILELQPPGEGADSDHTAASYRWEIFILAGDPSKPEHAAKYHPAVSPNGWLARPDNIAFDPKGRMWIATDGAPDWGIADGLYGVDTIGPGRALPKLIYAAPIGAEVSGPCFTPDGQTLFLSVQHPAEDSDTLDALSTRWPDFDDKIPARPSVVVITRDGGGEIGV